MQSFDYIQAASIAEATKALSRRNARVLAGGTDMLVRMKGRVWTPDVVVDITRIPRLNEITRSKTGLRLGAAVTMRQVELSEDVWDVAAAVAEGASVVGSLQIRNLATVAGNVCNAAPSADTAPGLIALNAGVSIAGPKGKRSMKIEKFILGPGKNDLKKGEFVTGITVPMPAKGSGSAYVRHTIREAMDIAVVGVGASVTFGSGDVCDDVRIVLGAVAPVPMRAVEAEAMLKGQKLTSKAIVEAAEVAAGEAKPITDVRSSAEFRRELVNVLTRRMVTAARDRAKGKRVERRVAA